MTAERKCRAGPTAAQPIVAIACWLDLLDYGGMMDAAGFDPSHPRARRPLARLRAFHRIVAEHSSSAFPTLVMNDGAVAYANVELVRSNKVWLFVDRCWRLYRDATATDRRAGGPGLRGVIAVGLRAKGSNRAVKAQEEELTRIVEDFASGRIEKADALAAVRRVRRVSDVVPPLQANFAFARAYEAERAGSSAGLVPPNLYLDTAVFSGGVPYWIDAGEPVDWTPARSSMATTFVPLRDIGAVPANPPLAFRTGRQLLAMLKRSGN